MTSSQPSNEGRKSEFNTKNSFSALAFTLAEVLIVLGIIGVVAELTIPTLMNNVESQVYKTGLKKAYSTLEQSYLSMRTDNSGSIANVCPTNDSDCLANLFKQYLQYTTSVSGIPNTTNLPGCWNNAETFDAGEPNACLVLNDGTSIVLDMEWADCNWRCGGVSVDVNGLKKPNKWGKDRFMFIIYDTKLYAMATSNYACNNGSGVWTDNLGCADNTLYR